MPTGSGIVYISGGPPMNGLFVTGTDTDVGKTVLSALLLAALRRGGVNAAPMKPVQTGCEGSAPDLDYALSMASMQASTEEYANMSPYRFEPACSPHLAAERAGAEINIAAVVTAAQALEADHDFIIAEGAGGILVPLNCRDTMLDLMQALKFPVLLAARPGLGTINHTLLSINALRRANLEVAGVVIVQSSPDKPGFIERDNIRTIAAFSGVPVLGSIPRCPELARPPTTWKALPEQVQAAAQRLGEAVAPG